MSEYATLDGGPQDGGRVKIAGDFAHLPAVLFCGVEPMGDGFVAWAREHGPTKPAKYIRLSKKVCRYLFVGYGP